MPDRRRRNSPRAPGKALDPVLFHPDYDRRLRNHTGSADLPTWERSRAWHCCLTAGGELHPALRTMQANLRE
jgi:hypothetical protein